MTEKQIEKIKNDYFVNGEFDIKENLTFFKKNREIFKLMYKRGIISERIGNKFYLTEKENQSLPLRNERNKLTPTSAITKHIKNASWELIIGVAIFIIGYAIGKYWLHWF